MTSLKRAVVLFNLGGPDNTHAVEPFLFNLFNDPAIINLPWFFRWPMARWISRRRAPVARRIYDHMGGGSPLLEQTRRQAGELEKRLGSETRVFICMRYWHPMSDETALAVKDFNPDEVVLMPLYPQFSTTTTASSLRDWNRASIAAKLTAKTYALCCYPRNPGLIRSHIGLIREGLASVPGDLSPRILFSAHGLPEKIVTSGDPYPWQVKQTAGAIMAGMDNGLDWRICYQSRVGRLKWIGPSLDAELKRAAEDGKAVVVVPIAFVSEHSETLVELDIEYRKIAAGLGVRFYVRIPTVSTSSEYMDGLAGLVERVLKGGNPIASEGEARLCPETSGSCIMANIND